MSKIFVQIASYRDPELIPTLKDLLDKADTPENLRICIAWQHSEKDEWDNLDEFKDDDRFIILDIPHTESLGACWARNKIQQEYTDEEYTLQLDSHHRFVESWDTKLITMLEKLRKKGHKKPLLTSYISSYDPKNEPDGRVNVPWAMKFDRFIPEGAIFFLPYHLDNPPKEPIPARFFSAHFTFTDGIFCKEVPHDPHLYFHGEEISLAVRAWTWGYDLFHPNEILAYHEYTRVGRTKQWDDDKDWGNKNERAHSRVRQLLGIDGEVCTPCNKQTFGEYGLGTERSLEEWEEFNGIRFKDRSVQQSVLDNKVPMKRDEPFFQKFRHPIEFDSHQLHHDDYSFAAIIFEDNEGNPLHREDAQEAQVMSWKQQSHITLWKEYNGKKAHKWIVWPYSKSQGWVDKIEVKL
jgi:hypothetical protein